MPTFEQGTVVRVPFRYSDRPVRQHRPALVVSDGPVGVEGRLLWVAMITSAENRAWDGDVDLGADFRTAGLPAPSLVRPAKIATIEASDAYPLGRLPQAALARVVASLRRTLGFDPRDPSLVDPS
ncbi:type II toxin-antitoxin system PemK/MazF family toxin [Pinisolibacter sp.]|uniref:type II toxin-antitoxin system PemK/MazF family toxin n=1 Tax=Pinisolibacter sp. TaxID=2172024 RepID=UPI002FDD8F78